MSTRGHVLRNAMFLSMGAYTEFVLGFLTSIIIARHLGPHFFGAYSGVIWLMAMGVAISNAGTASAAIKFIAEQRAGGHDDQIAPLLDYLRRAQRKFMIAVLAVCILVILVAGNQVSASLDTWIVLGFLLATIPLRAGYMFNVGVAKGFQNFRANALVVLVAAPVNLLMVMIVSWLGMSVYWQLGVFFVSSMLFYLLSRYRIAPLLPARVPGVEMSQKLVRRVRHHMFYSALTVGVSFWVASDTEVLFLNLYGNAEGAGQFKVAYQLAFGAANLVPGIFGALLLPLMASALTHGRKFAGRRFVASTTYLALLAVPLIAVGIVFSSNLVGVFYGREYLEAGPALAVCLAGTAMTAMTQGAASLLVSADRQRSMLAVVIGCGVLKLLLDSTLIYLGGLQGAVTAFTTVCVVQAAALMVLAIRNSAMSPDWYRLLRIVLAAALAAVMVWPLQQQLAPLAALIVGSMLLVSVYLIGTLLFGCWSQADIAYLQQLHARIGGSRSVPGGRLLAWAHHRAYKEAAL